MTYKSLFYLMIVWFHDYALPDAWTDRFNSLYQAVVSRYELQSDLDWHALKAFAIIESRQKPHLRGGGGNAFYGLFQISRDLAKFANVKRSELFDPEINAMVAGKAFSWYKARFLEYGYDPSKVSIEYRTALFYGAHNAGPNIIKRCIPRTKTLEGLVVCYARLLELNGYSRSEAKYRASLALLAVWLRRLSKAGGTGKISIKWWICRDYALATYAGQRWKVGQTLSWSSRTRLLMFVQARNDLPLTGSWDERTEKVLTPYLSDTCRR